MGLSESKLNEMYESKIQKLEWACIMLFLLVLVLAGITIHLYRYTSPESLSKRLEVVYIDQTHESGTFIGLNDGWGTIWDMYMESKPDMGEPKDIRVTYNIVEDCYYWNGYPMYIIDPDVLHGLDEESPNDSDTDDNHVTASGIHQHEDGTWHTEDETLINEDEAPEGLSDKTE